MASVLRPPASGKLGERITLQRNTPTINSRGAEEMAWANLATAPTVWALVQGASGGEQIQDNRDLRVARHRITIRWRTDLTTDDRVIWHASGGDRTLAIDDINDPFDPPRVCLQLACYEVIGEAKIG